MLFMSSHTFSLDDSLDSPVKKRKASSQIIKELKTEKKLLAQKVNDLNHFYFDSLQKNGMISTLQRENNTLRATNIDLETKYNDLRQNIPALQGVIRQNYTHISGLQTSLDNVTNERDQLLQENMRLQRELEELRNAQILKQMYDAIENSQAEQDIVNQDIEPSYSDEIFSSGTHLNSSPEKSPPRALFQEDLYRVIPETPPLPEPSHAGLADLPDSQVSAVPQAAEDIVFQDPEHAPQDDREQDISHAAQDNPQVQLLSIEVHRKSAAPQAKKKRSVTKKTGSNKGTAKPTGQKPSKAKALGTSNSKAVQKNLDSYFQESSAKRRKTSETSDDQENR